MPPDPVAEENWFFRLSRYTGRIREALESGRVRIVPAARRNEVLTLLRDGLTDISVSRPAGRAAGWGIPVPGDPGQVVYVWWDALANYLTALGYADRHRWWGPSGERVHVIGKGIVRFHAVHWLALLLSAGHELPTGILVHDYLTVDGAKLAKSAGNTVDPVELTTRYGTDAVRWWLLREPAPLGDTDFTVERLVRRADHDLANGLGNLVHRVLALAWRLRDGWIPETGVPPGRLGEVGAALPGTIDSALSDFDLRAATGALRAVVEEGNRWIEAERPWDPAAADRLDTVLGGLIAVLRLLTVELEPFLPSGAARLRDLLLAGDRVARPAPAFARLDSAR